MGIASNCTFEYQFPLYLVTTLLADRKVYDLDKNVLFNIVRALLITMNICHVPNIDVTVC